MQIAIINFGGQYVELIGRSVRSCGVRPEIIAPEQFPSWLKTNQPRNNQSGSH